MKESTFNSDFNLSIKEYSANKAPLHRHNYFELIYVLEGRGLHIINENQLAYAKDDMFLLTPSDAHSFQAQERSVFCILDFTSAFFERGANLDKKVAAPDYFFKQLEYLFQNTAQFNGYIRLNESDMVFSGILIRRLISVWSEKVIFKEIVLKNIVFLLVHLMTTKTETASNTLMKQANKTYEMIAYIQHHIYEAEKLTIENLAAEFNLAKDYAGAYFKKHSGKTIRQLVLDYKLELVKTRLQYSDLTISQISAELHFTDESHLNKTFKNKYGMTARQYKNNLRQ